MVGLLVGYIITTKKQSEFYADDRDVENKTHGEEPAAAQQIIKYRTRKTCPNSVQTLDMADVNEFRRFVRASGEHNTCPAGYKIVKMCDLLGTRKKCVAYSLRTRRHKLFNCGGGDV